MKWRMFQISLLLLFIFHFPVTLFADAKKAESLYQAILKNGWLEEKKELGRRLGGMGAPAESYILKLLNHDSYWERHAGIEACLKFNSPPVNKKLVNLYLEDHMTDSEAERVLKENVNRYMPILILEWESSRKKVDRERILTIIGESNSDSAVKIIRDEIEDKTSPFRIKAFQILASKKSNNENEYIRSKLGDKDLKSMVLKYILETGNKADKDLMLEVLKDPKTGDQELIWALGGIKKWGTYLEQETEYAKTLESRTLGESSKEYAMILFKEFRNESIRGSICELAKKAKVQETRMTAAENLIPFQDIKNITCIQRMADEAYIQGQSHYGAIDIFATFITLGFSNVMKGIQENKSRANFSARQAEIKKHLQFLELKAKDATDK